MSHVLRQAIFTSSPLATRTYSQTSHLHLFSASHNSSRSGQLSTFFSLALSHLLSDSALNLRLNPKKNMVYRTLCRS
jgi:hypothetical protein